MSATTREIRSGGWQVAATCVTLEGMTKTVLFLDDSVAMSLNEVARRQGKERDEVIYQAISEYLSSRSRPKALGIGAYQSGRSDISERIEELFAERDLPGS